LAVLVPVVKITTLITDLSAGGAQNALYKLLLGTQGEEIEHRVVSLTDMGTFGQKICDLGVPVDCLNMPVGKPTYQSALTLRKLITTSKPDVIQGWMYHGNFAALFGAFISKSRAKTVWNVRQCLYDLMKEKFLTRQVIRMNKAMSSNIDEVIFNSHLAKTQHEKFGFETKNTRIIPNGFELDKFLPSAQMRQKTRTELNIAPDVFVIGNVGRYHPMKDHETFLAAAVQIARKFETVCFLLVGKGVSFQNEKFKSWIPEELRKRFYLIGESDNLPGIYNSMDVFCHSAWSEAFPNVLGEAMAVGVPSVATDVGDCSLLLSGIGTLVPAKSHLRLSEALGKLVLMSKADREQIGNLSRSRIIDHYSLSFVAKEYIKIYRSLDLNVSS
jgi:glycosyltransferase involved in cell wall biosynthesis